MNIGEQRCGRLRSMKTALEKKGMQTSDLRFIGLPLSDLSREDLEVILGFQAMKNNDNLGEDVSYAGQVAGPAHKSGRLSSGA